jgi:hypothetical protein
MLRKFGLVLPCDPEYMGHREAEKRRQETRKWLLLRERGSIAPSIVPEQTEGKSHWKHNRGYSHSHR